jgi:hypothetical protein
MSKHSKHEREEQLAKLREWLKPGDTVHTILDHVSSSGMSRDIRLVLIKADDNGQPYTLHPNHAAAVILGMPRARRGDGLRVTGCGMDMGFHIVYTLSAALFPDGFECIGENCPSNDHSNGDRNYSPHHHSCGGYALRHRWL